MRVLVTGGTGYVGPAVARELRSAGHDVVLLVRTPVPAPHVLADVRDAAALTAAVAAAAPDGVCHLAGLTRVRDSVADPAAYRAVNAGGTAHLLAALAAAGRPVSFVLASSAVVYGGVEGELTEERPVAPANPYGASKATAERLVGAAADHGWLAAASLRCFNAAGAVGGVPDRDPSRLVPRTLAVAAGEQPCLAVNGDGGARRDYAHVGDIALAYRLALEAAEPGRHRVFNVGSGTGRSVLEVVDAARRVTGHPVPVEHRPPVAEARTVLGDITRIRSELGWTPARSHLDVIVADAWAALDPL